MVLALYQAAWVVPSRYVTETNVVRQGAEERNPVSNQYRHASDNETLDEPGSQKPLNRDSPVDIEMLGATGRESRNDVSRMPGHLFHHSSNG